MSRRARLLRELGWPAALAALLTLAALAGSVWLQATQARLEGQRKELSARRQAVRPPPAVAAAGPAAFLASLPPDSERQARTAALLGLAGEQGLPWPRSEFRYQADRELGLAQYRIAMSVSGRYDSLRSYVSEALRRDPALALEAVKLRRDSAGRLQADLAWVLHMRAAR